MRRLIDADELLMAHGLREYDDTEQIMVATFYQIARWIEDAPTVVTSGWIPVTERLPEMHDSIFARFKGTDRWVEDMWEKSSDVVLVSVQGPAKNNKAVASAFLKDGKWSEVRIGAKDYKIIAWMPLPDPYGE